MQTPKVQVGISDNADFEKSTWTFTMEGDYRTAAGRYAILTEQEYQRLLALAQEGDARL